MMNGLLSIYLGVVVTSLLTLSTVTAQDTGELRVVNSTVTGPNRLAGRLEIYDNGVWQTICINGFDHQDATLACNQLGYQSYENYGTVGQLGYPSASVLTPIWAADVSCSISNPSHLTLYQCPRGSSRACTHTNDVALICEDPYRTVTSGVLLTTRKGDTSAYLTAGRVNIFFAGRWGTICSDGFTLSDAQGLCHILTGSSNVLTYGSVGSDNLEFDQASTDAPVWIENFQCTYSFTDLRYYCTHSGLGITDCTHRQDLAISCLADGATRLVSEASVSNNDPGSSAGRLEIYHNGRWGTVCDDFFDLTDADIVCSQLGYRRADRYGTVSELGYTEGTGTIWLDDVRCNSTDVFLANCSHRGFGVENCDHNEDVAISCTQSDHNEGNLRFINDTHIFSSAGRLEIYLNGHWGTICSTGFGPEDATLACNQLGYETYQRYGTAGQLGYPQGLSSTPILVSNLACDTSNTSHLTVYHCPRSDGSTCSHSQDVALICSSPYSTATSAVRLVTVNGRTSSSLTAGRVEIFFAGRWGTICSQGFTLQDAMGLCHFLTRSADVLSYGAVGSDNLQFEEGSISSPVWVQNFHCMYHTIDGRYYCDRDGLGITSCTHSMDLALSCQADGAVRLVAAQTVSTSDPGDSAGRLEVYHNRIWGTVCDAGFSRTDADVVCRQLGYEGASTFGNVGDLGYSQGTGTIWLTNVRCTSENILLANCSHSGFFEVQSCGHGRDVAVTCVQKSSGSSFSTGAIAGISIGIIAAIISICIATTIAIVACRRKSKSRQHLSTPQSQISSFKSSPLVEKTHIALNQDSIRFKEQHATAPPQPNLSGQQPPSPYPYPGPQQAHDMPQYPAHYPQYPQQYPMQYEPPPCDPPSYYPAQGFEHTAIGDPQGLHPAVGDARYYPSQH